MAKYMVALLMAGYMFLGAASVRAEDVKPLTMDGHKYYVPHVAVSHPPLYDRDGPPTSRRHYVKANRRVRQQKDMKETTRRPTLPSLSRREASTRVGREA